METFDQILRELSTWLHLRSWCQTIINQGNCSLNFLAPGQHTGQHMLKSQNTTEITTLIKDYSDDKTFEKKKKESE